MGAGGFWGLQVVMRDLIFTISVIFIVEILFSFVVVLLLFFL
jgi:hypothetical protein